MKYYKKSAFNMFVHDWGIYVREKKIKVTQTDGGSKIDVLIVHPNIMPLKECTYLNRQLGLGGINLIGNTNCQKI